MKRTTSITIQRQWVDILFASEISFVSGRLGGIAPSSLRTRCRCRCFIDSGQTCARRRRWCGRSTRRRRRCGRWCWLRCSLLTEPLEPILNSSHICCRACRAKQCRAAVQRLEERRLTETRLVDALIGDGRCRRDTTSLRLEKHRTLLAAGRESRRDEGLGGG